MWVSRTLNYAKKKSFRASLQASTCVAPTAYADRTDARQLCHPCIQFVRIEFRIELGTFCTMAPQAGAKADVVARLMRGLRQGSAEAKRELVAMLFPELRRLAAAKMSRERV